MTELRRRDTGKVIVEGPSIKEIVEKCAREGVSMYRADLSEANLTGVSLIRANLSRADLAWADLSEANLAGADLSEANLTEANLTGADLYLADGIVAFYGVGVDRMTKEDLQKAFFRVVEERDKLWNALFNAQYHVDPDIFPEAYKEIQEALNDSARTTE